MSTYYDVAGNYSGRYVDEHGDHHPWEFSVDLGGQISTVGTPDLSGLTLEPHIQGIAEFKAGDFHFSPISRYRGSTKVRALAVRHRPKGVPKNVSMYVERPCAPSRLGVPSDFAGPGYYGVLQIPRNDSPEDDVYAVRFRYVEGLPPLGEMERNFLMDISYQEYSGLLSTELYDGDKTKYRLELYGSQGNIRLTGGQAGREDGVRNTYAFFHSDPHERMTRLALYAEDREYTGSHCCGYDRNETQEAVPELSRTIKFPTGRDAD